MREIKTYEHFFVNYLYKLGCNIFFDACSDYKMLKIIKLFERFEK